MTKQFRATMAAILTISTISLPAQTTTASKPATTKKAAAKKAPVESPVEREIRELREQMLNQQSQIDALKRQNAEQASQLSAAQQSAQAAQSAAAAASAKAESLNSNVSSNAETVATLNNTVTDLKSTNVGLAQTISDTKKSITDAMEVPSRFVTRESRLPRSPSSRLKMFGVSAPSTPISTHLSTPPRIPVRGRLTPASSTSPDVRAASVGCSSATPVRSSFLATSKRTSSPPAPPATTMRATATPFVSARYGVR